MAISITRGDLLKQEVDAIVNAVNCEGVMGKGIALQFRNRWTGNYNAYRDACKQGRVQVGQMFVYDNGVIERPHYIFNFPTKKHWRDKSKLEFVRDGLLDLVEQIKKLEIQSIAIPALGCGLGGLEWHDVRPLIESTFAELPHVEVRLFVPGF